MPPPPPPLPLQEHTRINLGDLKSQIARKLGPEQARSYFGCLNQLLAQKLTKTEFNKFCLLNLGREFIPLHNQLIRSILKNACQAKTPPLLPAHHKGTLKHAGAVEKKSVQGDDGFNPASAPVLPTSVWPNGDILPPSPRKSRSSIRDRKIKDRASLFGPNGRADVIAHQSSAALDDTVIRENGILGPCDLKRPMQHHQDWPVKQPTKRPRIENSSPCNRISVRSKGLVGVATFEDEEELKRNHHLNSIQGPLRAPLGIPFCHASVGGARRSLLLASITSIGSFTSSNDNSELCHTEALWSRMKRISETQGLGGVTVDCANLLNIGLDAYLKRLIKSCVELVGARSGHEPIKHLPYKQHPHRKHSDGVWPGNNMHAQSSSRPLGTTQDLTSQSLISLQDFRVAMELNPQLLGEDWPLLLEKICLCSFE